MSYVCNHPPNPINYSMYIRTFLYCNLSVFERQTIFSYLALKKTKQADNTKIDQSMTEWMNYVSSVSLVLIGT